jgi:bifunctional non-homologous end joining protein LigD
VTRPGFIGPSAPISCPGPPTGREWLHEIVHGGMGAQLHLIGHRPVIFSRKGIEVTSSFGRIADALVKLPVRSVIIEAQLTTWDALSATLSTEAGRKGLCACSFDLLELNGNDWRPWSCEARRAMLKSLVGKGRALITFSEDFSDPLTLREAAGRLGLAGIISKRRTQPYMSGQNPGWITVKIASRHGPSGQPLDLN